MLRYKSWNTLCNTFTPAHILSSVSECVNESSTVIVPELVPYSLLPVEFQQRERIY